MSSPPRQNFREEGKRWQKWHTGALIVAGTALIAVGGWSLFKYVDKAYAGKLAKARQAVLRGREAAPFFYQGNFDKLPLYKLIAPDGSEHWLLGTMHTSAISINDFPKDSKVFEALRQANIVMPETVTSAWDRASFAVRRDMEKILKTRYADETNPFGKETIGDVLDDNYLEKLRNEFKFGMDKEIKDLEIDGLPLEQNTPDTLVHLMESIARQMSGSEMKSSMDEELVHMAQQTGKKVMGLESYQDGINAYKEASRNRRWLNKDDLIQFIDGGGVEGRTKELLQARDAYGRGELDNLNEVLEKFSPIREDLRHKFLLDNRNQKWMQSGRIQKNCSVGNTCMLVVGAGHLFDGNSSLVKLLQEEGFKVEKAYPD